MKLDENVFFRQATLRICSSLDIEAALFNCLQYIRAFMPASQAFLGLFEPSTRVIRCLAIVDLAGGRKSFPPTQLPGEVIQGSQVAVPSRDLRIIEPGTYDSLARLLHPFVEFSDCYLITMNLAVGDKNLGVFSLMADRNTRFTEDHLHLVSLLREPFSIAVSNAVRFEEVVRLKEMLDAENRELSRELGHLPGNEIVGAEHGLRMTMEMVREVAPLNSPVMLLGETGVGKEVVANAIHFASHRRTGPLIKVNCGAIPETLLDSELFGHERGAFTGAIAQKRGRFERADKGSIFLDEIGELPPPAQVRLLRVLQNKEIERVGGTRTFPVDVRIIAATHRNLEELVLSGAFREDLWFRLNVFPIMIPPLRERKEDIPALVHHLIKKKSRELKIYPPPSVSAGDLARFKAYHWPGNIRELENLIERELIRTRGRRNDGWLRFGPFELSRRNDETVAAIAPGRQMLTLDEAMSHHIRQALKVTNGKISGPGGAAQLLGINPNTLRSRMRKMGIALKYSCG